jgi:hypothetical protein
MRRLLLALAALLPACTAALPERECDRAEGPVAWVIERAWHTEIAVAPEDLTGRAAELRVPGAASISFGFGKRDFMLTGGPAQWIAGPLPGPAVVQVTALRVEPDAAYLNARMVRLPLSPEGMDRLSAFLRRSFREEAGRVPGPIAIVQGSAFHDASRGYSLIYTCNTWTAEALAEAGLPVEPAGVVLTYGVMSQAAAVPGACRPRR